MNAKFKKIIEEFPILMQKLKNSPFVTKNDISGLPDKGIYVFYEKNPDGIEKPIYIGRSERLKARLKEHSQPSSRHTSATFAFNRAKLKAKASGIDIKKSRDELEAIPEFEKIYNDEKDIVSKMSFKVIRINNPIRQTLFEVYASLELKTEQDWGTH